MAQKVVYLLTGDIGGTNSRMALYSVDDTIPLVEKYYRNQDCLKAKADGVFEKNVISPFLQHCWETNKHLVPLERVEIVASLAIAGPVRDNKVSMSNLHDIVIDGEAIADKRFAPKDDEYLATIQVCKIINDFVAQGYGCLTLKPDEVKELVPGSLQKVDPNGPKVCVGAGTGLGECFLTPDSEGAYTCFPSEGGHVEWAPRNALEVKLWQYLADKFSYKHRVSVERVVSGRGLANCYEFLANEFPKQVNQKVHKEFLEAGDLQGKIVSDDAHTNKGSLGEKAMEIMCSAYGCEVGSAGIKWIPTGGLYVTGGLTPKNMQFIEGQDSPFMKAFHDKGRVTPILNGVPLFAVLVEDLGVRGALKSAEIEYEKYRCGHGGGGDSKSSMSSVFSTSSAAILTGASCVTALAVGVIVGSLVSKSK
eukprot:Nitzschia sp. Nitz4//scaffold181_size46380//32888//34250//NITZ4_007182-RA/size46380-augustus-gene-0.45-mRNA-1//1//CDS//3329539525//8286//frame0